MKSLASKAFFVSGCSEMLWEVQGRVGGLRYRVYTLDRSLCVRLRPGLYGLDTH